MDFDFNRIQKVIFDVHYYDQASALPLQNQIISEFNSKIKGILDENLTSFLDEYLVSAKNIEINLGTLSIDDVSNNLSVIFDKELKKTLNNLSKKIVNGELPKGVELISYDNLIYEYLFHFFNLGTIPWNLEDFGKTQSVAYWINYLSINNFSLIEKLIKVFHNQAPRKRLLSIISNANKSEVFNELFTKSVSVFLLKVESLLYDIVRKIGFNWNDIKNEIDHFILFLGTEANLLKKTEYLTIELAEEFYRFIQSNIQEISHSLLPSLLPSFIGVSKRAQNLTEEEVLFIEVVEAKYISHTQIKYSIQFEPEADHKIVQQNVQYFERFIQINQKEQYAYLQKLSEDIVLLINRMVSSDSRSKTDDIVRGIIIESLKAIQLPRDKNTWIEILLAKLLSVFGLEAHKELSKLLVAEKIKLTDFEPDKTEIDKVYFTKAEIVDGSKIYKLNVQQGIKYVELLSDYGFYALQNLFDNPKESFEEIIVWLKRVHNRQLVAALKKMHLKISPLHLWRLNEVLSKEVLEIINPPEYKPEALGKILLLEIFKRGFIPMYEFNLFGKLKIKDAITSYFQVHLADLAVQLETITAIITSAKVRYLKDILDVSSFNQFQEVIGRVVVVEKDKGELDSSISLLKLQNFLPLFFNGLLSEDQIESIIKNIERQIDLRNSDFAVFLVSLSKNELLAIKDRVSGSYKTKIEQLLISYKYKYEADLTMQDQEPLVEEKVEEVQFKLFNEGEVSYINNAGLVLINPYITALFTKLNLLENKMFISDRERVRGMQIMQYIVNKNDRPEEPDLLLNKVLVGLDPNYPIDRLYDISREEKEMCEGLIDAIIKHWSVLKSTTRDNLRASFLMRNGKISFEESNWRLKVEQKSIDVLIDKLPWSVSMIKLPWMKLPLLTDWR